MADLIFPPSPSTGDEFTGTFGEVYTWDGEKWSLTAGGTGGGAGAPVIGDEPPADPTLGQLYWDLPTAKLFLWDGAQWVVVVNTPEGGGTSGPPMGVTDGSEAGPGEIGEVLSVTGLGAFVNLTATGARASDVVSMVLPPGDWEVKLVAAADVFYINTIWVGTVQGTIPIGYMSSSLFTTPNVPGIGSNMIGITGPIFPSGTSDGLTWGSFGSYYPLFYLFRANITQPTTLTGQGDVIIWPFGGSAGVPDLTPAILNQCQISISARRMR